MTSHLAPDAREATVGEIARRSGVATSALRFYEREGLIKSRRTGGNQRRYSRDTLRRVAFIRTSQGLGIPLATIRDVLGLLPEDRTPTREDWARISERWRADLDARIRTLERLRDSLSDCIGCGCLSLTKCTLSNPRDDLGSRGPGARRFVEDPSSAGGRGSAAPDAS
ncbi:redox-sensitive transcriptional activator SoxR [Streptomyces kanamyceticus]|uniref:Redox-sensitive transcriptional activator SoxR n=1 Tax=Streptomyces kanamyceticus TaxID=1967 RepID=A0A5J6GHC9_STRKN|nr:redox-sensitive transcriptional activator SoxR [Streptomyces kanamyceticus]QEU94533.1 redox-sensitive transcriptional activator SoxR [Streptomyces kanamyceticus]